MDAFEKKLIQAFKNNQDRIFKGDYDGLLLDEFSHMDVLEPGPSQKVITLHYRDDVKDAVPPARRHVDIFILKAGRNLGAHFHKHASADITIILGTGKARIDEEWKQFKEQSKLRFPAGKIHDVEAAADTDVAFISFQDNPIVLPGGKLDYYSV